MAGDVGGRSCTDSELLLLHPELLSQEFLLLTLEQKNIAVENDIRINKDNLTDLYVQHAIPLPQRDLPKNRWGKMMEKKREQHELKNETKRSSAVDVLSKKRPLIVFDGSSTSTSIKVKKTDSGDNDRLKAPPQASFTSNAFRKLSNSSSSVSPLPLSSNLPMNNKMEHNNNDTKQNHDFPLGPVKLPPLSPVGTTPVKLKRAAPKEEAEAMSFQTASTKSTIVWMAQATNISFLYSWSLGSPKSKHWQIQCMNNLKPPEAKRKIQHVTWP